jgi:hypothetical protein
LAWNEKFLAKARSSDIKDIFFSKFTIPNRKEEINEKTDEGNSTLKTSNLNVLAYIEFISSVHVRTSSNSKGVFNMVKSCKNKDFIGGNAAMAWNRLKNKYELIQPQPLLW